MFASVETVILKPQKINMSEVAPRSFRYRVIWVYTLLGAANIGAWVWAILAFHDKPLLLGTAFLAYSFGLRHAVDADHIAAIDNVTRKLMQEGQRPVSVGFFFSLGHSTISVCLLNRIRLTNTRLMPARFWTDFDV